MAASKSGSTRVSTAKFVTICTKLGLHIDARKGWLLAYRAGQKDRRLLIHTGKNGTNCVELVGFESKAAIAHPCPPAKTMTQMLDCNLPEAQILRAFYKTAQLLASSSPAAPATTEEAVTVSAATESAVLA